MPPRAAFVSFVTVLIVAALAVGTVPPTVAADDGGVAKADTCSRPVELKQRMDRLWEEVVTTHENDLLTSDTKASIETWRRKAESSFAAQAHCEAREGYRTAIELAVPALRKAYRRGAAQRLDAVEEMVAAEQTDGNPDPDAGALKRAVREERNDLDNATSLSRARKEYADAGELRAAARKRLPTSAVEQALEAFAEKRLFAGFAGFMTLVVAGSGLLWRRAQSTDDSLSITDR